MRNLVVLSVFVILLFSNSFAQTPGQIFLQSVPSPSILDPNGDGWSTTSGGAYVSNDGDSENEINWVRIPNGSLEDPEGDLATGATCGQSDITDDPANDNGALFLNFTDLDGVPDNGDEYFLFRIRMATTPIGAFGYSILLDTDSKFGFSGPDADPNACSGNAGFELEIQVKSGGSSGVYIYDVDGECSGPGTIMGTYSLATHTQRVYALAQDPACAGAQPIFYDFWIPYSALGISSSTPIAASAATSSSPGSVLGGSASDIGGINDALYSDQDSMFVAAVNSFIRTSPDDLASGCFDTAQTDVPVINALQDTSSVITGTSTEADSSRIHLIRNGDSLGIAYVISGVWSYSVYPIIIQEGDKLLAYADADCETPSDTTAAEIRIGGNHIFINELSVNEYAGQDEWIELYNDADYPIDVSCYTICDGDFCITLPTVTTIPAKGFLTIGSSTTPGTVDINVTTCGCISGTFDLDDSAEQLAVFDVDGAIEDATKWGAGDLGGATAVSNAAIGSCGAFSNTMPASGDATYENIGATGGTDSCVFARFTDASATWVERCTADITQDASNNTVSNNKPVAADDAGTTMEDNDISIVVQVNDSDPDGDPLTTTIISSGSNGTASVIAGSVLYYSPNPNFNGLDTVTYMICDTGAAKMCDTAKVVITVTSVNDLPIATDDFELTGENTAITKDVMSNDSDADGDVFSPSIITNGTNGSAVINGDGTITYTPNASFIGFDFVTYAICEDAVPTNCDTAIFTINVGQPCLVINEIDFMSSTSGEYVELWNTCCYDVDISCHSIADGDFVMTVPNGTTLSASDYYVMGNSGSIGSVDLKAGSCGGCVSGTFDFTSAKEQLVLFSNQGVIQDAIQWGAGDLKKDVVTADGCGTAITVPKNATAGIYENIGGAPSLEGCSKARATDNSTTWGEKCGFLVTQGFSNGTTNNRPVTQSDFDTTSSGTATTTDVQANDVEPDGELMETTILINPSYGSAIVLNVDSIKFTPTAGYVGDDYLVYQVCDTVCPVLCASDTLYFNIKGCIESNGTGGGDWHTASSWVGGVVPGSNDCIIVLAGDSIIMNADAEIRTVTINSGGALVTGSNTLSVNGDFTNLGNYDNTGGTTAFVGTTTQNIAGNNSFHNLIINNPDQVEITALDQSVTGVLTLTQGTLDLNGNNFTFDNDSILGGEQGRIGAGGSGTISGTVGFERSFTNCSTDGYTYFASPLHGTTFADWADDIWITGATGAYDPTGWSNVYYYNEADTGAVDSGWVAVKNTSNSVIVGKGYSVYSWNSLGTAPTQVSVSGTVDLSPFNFSASFNDDVNRDDATHDGWNLMGNPYPATLDWNSGGWTKDGCCDYVASFSPCEGDYSTYSGGVGVNGGTGQIPAFQSFWVKANGTVTPNLAVTRDAIVSDNQQFFKKKSLADIMKFKISSSIVAGDDEVAFRLRSDATVKTDIIDAVKFYFPDYKPSMYTKVATENEVYAINQLPNDGSLKELELYVRVPKTGQYTLDIEGINSFETSKCILIEDLVTKDIIDPRLVSSYTFNQDLSKDYTKRFLIKFNYLINTVVKDVSCSGANDGKVTANVSGVGPFTYIWESADGSELRRVNKMSNTDDLSNVKGGIYYLSVINENVNSSFCTNSKTKIIVNEPNPIKLTETTVINPGCKSLNDGIITVEAIGGNGVLEYKWSNKLINTKITGLTSGTYTVTISDANCSITESFTLNDVVSVNSSFSLPADTVSVSNGGTVEFLNNSTGATNYLWSFGNGEKSVETPAKTHYNMIGSFDVMLIASNQYCSDTVIQKLTTYNEVVLVGTIQKNNKLYLYQFDNQLNLKMKFDTPKDVLISLYSIDGKQRFSRSKKDVTTLTDVINISGLASGLYIVNVTYPGGSVSGKVYINR